MPTAVSSTGPRFFPLSRVLLPRTRLAYINLRNLLSDAKRDRAARISGYVAIWMPDELVILYLLDGELVNATVRDGKGCRPIAISTAIEQVPGEPEYGEISFQEADQLQLACMFATHAEPADPWPGGMVMEDPATLFPFLKAQVFDGVLEIVANDSVNYLVFKHGGVARAFLAGTHPGTAADAVAKLFARERKPGELRIGRWGVPQVLPIQAPAALVQAYRDLTSTLVQRLVDHGRESAPAIAEHARLNLLAAHPVLDGFSPDGPPVKEPIADTPGLTAGVAAWIREVVWAAADHDAVSPEALLRELTWDRRHMFQSAGFYDQIPWKLT